MPDTEVVHGDYDPRMGANMEPIGPLTAEHIARLEAEKEEDAQVIDSWRFEALDLAEEVQRLRKACRSVTKELEAPYGENGVIPEHIQKAAAILDRALHGIDE